MISGPRSEGLSPVRDSRSLVSNSELEGGLLLPSSAGVELWRLWLYCFLRNHSNENFFYTWGAQSWWAERRRKLDAMLERRGYMDIIDDMNGPLVCIVWASRHRDAFAAIPNLLATPSIAGEAGFGSLRRFRHASKLETLEEVW